jgi:hypothetical protein
VALDKQRYKFHAAFGYLFPPTSPTMVQKCWMAVKRSLPSEDLDTLISAMLEAGVEKSNSEKRRTKR